LRTQLSTVPPKQAYSCRHSVSLKEWFYFVSFAHSKNDLLAGTHNQRYDILVVIQYMKKITIIGLVVVLIMVGILGWFFMNKSSEQQVSKLDVIDTVGNFYDTWLAAEKDGAVEPNQATLAKSPILSKTLRDKLKEAVKQNVTPDPVLCQTVIPEDISLRLVREDAEKAEVLVTSKDTKVTEQAIITLLRLSDGWYINDIRCSLGEFEPEREFTFEREGYLLKGSVPKPYDSKNWHLVFEENGKQGHVAPLFFNAESQCTNLDGSKAVCKPDQFTEATKVLIRGDMSERGATVKQLEFVKE
jgi:hypothetical protein